MRYADDAGSKSRSQKVIVEGDDGGRECACEMMTLPLDRDGGVGSESLLKTAPGGVA